MPGLVIFDCDGVLVDTELVSARVLAEMVNAAGWTVGEAEVRAMFEGGTLETVVAVVEERTGRPLPPGWLDEFQARRDDAFRAGIEPVAGAADAVRGVRALGFDVCVASQARVSKTRLTLGLTGLLDLFDPERLFSATMVPRPKPYPDLFLHAATQCGYPAEACTVIEDALLGVQGARAAGMRVLAYPAHGDPAALADAGGELIDRLAEVPGRLA